jgi:predicted outer membrane repeat protein
MKHKTLFNPILILSLILASMSSLIRPTTAFADDGGTWATRASMPTARYLLGVVATPNGKIYAIGGWGGPTAVEEYDLATDTWTVRASMPTARYALGVAAAANGKIYAIGGLSDVVFSTVEEYDPVTDTWTARASMPTPRYMLSVTAAANGKLYAIGGYNYNDGVLSTVEEYDPATDTWTTRASMPTPRHGMGVAAAANGKLYAIGGWGGGSTVEEYDPATDTWTTRASMPTARDGVGVAAAANGKLYAIGGRNNGELSTVEEYDPATDTWATRASMPTARSDLGVVAAPNGKLYAIGGHNNGELFTVEEYTPQSAQHVLYVKPSGSTSGLCDNWSNACELQYALATTISGNEIWVAVGKYTPTTGTDRTATFQLKSGVAMYGGFVGTETIRSQRNPAASVTILSGDLNGDDVGFANNTENSYHVVVAENITGATLDGFTVTGGNATVYMIGPNTGGGIAISSSSLTLTNDIISGNVANYGGGMIVSGGNLTLTNVTISGNLAGGGFGGGVFISGSSPTLTNVTFAGNSAGSYGGGMIISGGGSPILTNVTFAGNSAVGGGAIYGGSPTIRNTIVWGNTAGGRTDVVGAQFYESAPIILDSVVQGGCPDGSTCTNIITADPKLGTLGNYGGFTQTIPLLAGSSAIDAGNSAYCTIGSDQRGVSYVGTCDIGAYEFVNTNHAPVISEGNSVSVPMNKNGVPTAFALTLHATDADANTLTWSISTPAGHGTASASGMGDSKEISYTPNTDYIGSDSFAVQVQDGNGGVDTIAVQVYVDVLHIRAYIDGESKLIISGDTVQWHHIFADAPGRWNGAMEPTYINGNAWYPTWPDDPNSDNQGCNCDSSTLTGVYPALPAQDQNVTMKINQARNLVSIVQQPNAGNGYTLIVDFDDSGPAAADWYDIEILMSTSTPPLNQPPSVNAGGPYTVDEGSSVTLTATGSDREGQPLTYAWDLDNNGSFETPGQSVSFTGIDGPSDHTVAVQVTDNGGLTATAQSTVHVNNIDPTATFNTPSSVNEGDSFALSLTNPVDVSADLVSLQYAFDCGSGYGAFSTSNTATCTFVDNPGVTVKGKVQDKDGGITESTTTVIVNNVAPAVVAPVVLPEPSVEGSSVTASATFTDPGVNDAPFTCTVNYGDGSGNLPGTIIGYTCTGPVHVYSAFGAYTVIVSVTDKDGGAGSKSTIHIVTFTWSGFFQPVDNLPVLNLVKAGSTVPMRFSLGDNKGLNIFAAGYPQSVKIVCNTGLPVDEIEQTVTAGSSSLSYDASSNQYNYVWKTDKTWTGTCRQWVVKLIDGTLHYAIFKFK